MEEQNPIVTFTMEDGKVMKAELYPEIALIQLIILYLLSKKDFMMDLYFTVLFLAL